jgi:hypothetical protein
LTERLDETLDEGAGVGRAVGGPLDSQPRLLERRIERPGKLGVSVVHDHIGTQLDLVGMLQEGRGLLVDPGFIGLLRGWRDKHTPSLDVEKNQQERVPQPLGRYDSLRHEVALPKRSGVNLNELVPRAVPALGARVVAVLLEDVLDGIPGNGADVELPELAEDPGVAPVVALGQFEDQLPNLLAGPPLSDLAAGQFRRLASLPNPAAQCARVNDCDELIKGTLELGTKPNQSTPFIGFDEHTFRQPAPENIVLGLQVGHVASEFFLGGGGQNQQQRPVDVAHRGIQASCGVNGG